MTALPRRAVNHILRYEYFVPFLVSTAHRLRTTMNRMA